MLQKFKFWDRERLYLMKFIVEISRPWLMTNIKSIQCYVKHNAFINCIISLIRIKSSNLNNQK